MEKRAFPRRRALACIVLPFMAICFAPAQESGGSGAATLGTPSQDELSWTPGIAVVSRPILDARRIELAREYSLAHYGIDDWRLEGPAAAVLHYTGTDSLAGSLASFLDDELPSARPDIAAGGLLNVGVHYLIAKDGTVYALLPEYAMGRHAIGYNRVSIGIELVGSRPESLSKQQLDGCAALVADIARRHPSLRYLFGHHEYEEEGRAHALLRTELLAGYAPTVKVDPGPGFMASLRKALLEGYSLAFDD